MGQNPEWSIVTELKKQYDVDSVSPDVADPVGRRRPPGGPALVADAAADRQPHGLHPQGGTDAAASSTRCRSRIRQNSPEVPKQPPGGMFGGGQPPEPKGDLRPPCSTCSASTGRPPISSGTPTIRTRNWPISRPRSSSSAGKGAATDAFNADQMRQLGAAGDRDALPRPAPAQGGRGARVHPVAPDQRHGRHDRLERGHPARLHGHFGHQPRSPPLRQRAWATPWPPGSGPRPGRAAEPTRKKDAEKKKDQAKKPGSSTSSPSPTST